MEGAYRFTSAVALIQNELVLIQPLQGAQTVGKWGIAMTVETEDFDREAFSSRSSLDVQTRVLTIRNYVAITELCRSV